MSKSALIETVFVYDEFVARLDSSRPTHYAAYTVPGPGARIIRNKLRIYGVSKSGELLVFESVLESSPYAGKDAAEAQLAKLIDQYARPLNSTPGRLRTILASGGGTS